MYYRITATRSTIGLPERIRKTFTALGLTKRGKIVYQPVTEGIAGQVAKVKELVKVELVDEKLSIAEERKLRSPPPGYTIEKRS